jgi:hypothetical protein
MFSRMRSHLSFANITALLALFVALSGTAYAAVKLPRNSVGAAQIKKNGVRASEVRRGAIGTSEVRNGALRAGDFRPGDLPAGAEGPRGPAGTNGTNGAPGTAAAFARVQPTGTLLPAIGDFPATSKGITQAMVTKPAAGTYCFTGMAFRPASAMVASDNAGAATAATNNVVLSVATERGNNLGGCPAGANARVVATQWTEAAAPANVDKGFVVWFEEG